MRSGSSEKPFTGSIRVHRIGRSTGIMKVLEELAWEDNNVAYHLIQTKERNLWRIVEKETQVVRGLLLAYVDDLLVMGDAVARTGLLKCIQSRWKTSTPETVDDQGWMRFCGYEKSHEGGLLLGQPSYLGELLQRRNIVDKKTVPLPKDAVPPPQLIEGVTAEEGAGHRGGDPVGGHSQSA